MTAEIKDLTKKYRRKNVLDGICFSMKSGVAYGLVGMNGSGKSTLISILAGVRKPDSGSFTLGGKNMLKVSENRELISYVPQADPLIPELTGMDNLLLWHSKEEIRRSVEDGFLKELGIEELLNVRVSAMSGGMKKRLSIGCSVSGGSKLLLMDEPGAALDLIAKMTIRDFMNSFKNKGGIVLISSHEPEELGMCDSLFLLKDGGLREIGHDIDVNGLIGLMRE